MPYISEIERKKFEVPLLELVNNIRSVGELNYVISRICHQLILEKEKTTGIKMNYIDVNAVIGVLESAKLEFYRSVVSPYEDVKISESSPLSNLDGKSP